MKKIILAALIVQVLLIGLKLFVYTAWKWLYVLIPLLTLAACIILVLMLAVWCGWVMNIDDREANAREWMHTPYKYLNED